MPTRVAWKTNWPRWASAAWPRKNLNEYGSDMRPTEEVLMLVDAVRNEDVQETRTAPEEVVGEETGPEAWLDAGGSAVLLQIGGELAC